MKKLLFVYIVLQSFPSIAQTKFLSRQNNATLWQDFTYDMGNVFKGIQHAYTRPLHWKTNDFIKLGGIAAGTFSLYLVDDDLNRTFTKNKQEIPPLLLDYGWYAGKPLNNYGITGAVYLTGLFTRNKKLRRTGVLLISSATATGFLQQVMKSGVGRARPSTGLGKSRFKAFDPTAAYSSFPSGHAILTFTTAHIIAKQFENKWVKAGLYTIGAVPGISRLVENAHWASDVFLSWSLSYFIVEAIDAYLDHKYEEKYNDSKPSKTDIELSFNGNGIGIQFSF